VADSADSDSESTNLPADDFYEGVEEEVELSPKEIHDAILNGELVAFGEDDNDRAGLPKEPNYEEVEDEKDGSSLERLDEVVSAQIQSEKRRRVCNSVCVLLWWPQSLPRPCWLWILVWYWHPLVAR